MIEMEELAKEKSKKTGETFQAWLSAIQWAADTETIAELTDGEFVSLINVAYTVNEYRNVVEFFEQHRDLAEEDSSGFDLLVEFADSSQFSISEWIKSLHVFKKWSNKSSNSVNLKRALGYIQCCCQEAKTGEGDLSAILLENLNTHGLQ